MSENERWPDRFINKAARRAREIEREARNRAAPSFEESGKPQEEESVDTDSPLYRHLFELQGEIEKEGPMNYHKFAARLWEKLTEEKPDAQEPAFEIFANSVVTRMRDIGMSTLVYPHVRESLVPLIEQYKDSVRTVSLWSQGDVEATGYQSAKIHSSGIVQGFLKDIIAQTGNSAGKDLFRQKTRYEVAGDKFQNLIDVVKEQVETQNRPVKVVIIEDSIKNFGVAEERLHSTLGESANRITIEKIWAVYSREGQRAQQAAENNGEIETFERKKKELNAIRSFSELLDTNRFGEILDDAYVFVDFDGVIADNIGMRDRQANAILSAAVDGLSQHWHLGREETHQRILERFPER